MRRTLRRASYRVQPVPRTMSRGMRGKGVILDGEEKEEGRQEEKIRHRGGDLRRSWEYLRGKGVILDGEEEKGRQEEEIGMVPRWGDSPQPYL